MANTLIVKHGGSKPEQDGHSLLNKFEMGFDYNQKILYINNDDDTLPIGADMSAGLPLVLGGTGAITQLGAFNNVVAPGGTLTGPLILGGTESETEPYKLPGIIALNETYSYGTGDPNDAKPLVNPPEGHLYFMLID